MASEASGVTSAGSASRRERHPSSDLDDPEATHRPYRVLLLAERLQLIGQSNMWWASRAPTPQRLVEKGPRGARLSPDNGDPPGRLSQR